MRRPFVFHLYVTLAFLSVLITYFGVNYFLGECMAMQIKQQKKFAFKDLPET